jgi:Na+/H+-dicarboxylate symporter
VRIQTISGWFKKVFLNNDFFNRNLIPDNIVSATFMSHYTALVPINPKNLTLGYKKVNEKAFKTNMLGLCVFSLILGFAISRLESKAENIKKLLEETNAVVMKIMMTLIK